MLEIIDIHTHITPGVDDGAPDATVAEAMVRQAQAQGVSALILTPHYNENTGMVQAPEKGFLQARKIADKLAMRVYTGNEVYYSSGAMKKLLSSAVYTLAGSKYVLAEFSYGASFDTLRGGVNELMLHGYTPVIAHIERYQAIYKNYVYDLLNMGALLQVNANSILHGGLRTKALCKKLLKEALVSFVASDCHNLAERSPNLGACAAVVEKKYGLAYGKKLFFENAQRLLANQDIVV